MYDAQQRNAFLKALAATGSVSCAAAMVGIDRTTAYVWRQRHPGFAMRWQATLARPRVCGPATGFKRHANLDLTILKLNRMARRAPRFFDNELLIEPPEPLEDQRLGDFR